MNGVTMPESIGRRKKAKQVALFFIFFYVVCCFLSFNRHSKAEVFDYHSEIFSDKAGYYVYLPALFIYDFKADKLPPKIDIKTGKGFSIDSAANKIITKYTYGVALMQAPFFIITHLLANRLGYPADGFSIIYDKMIDVVGVFYADLAFIFLYFFLIRYVPEKIAIIALVCIFLGTNVFYYFIFETGMSHVYSFFLFSVFLYLSGVMFKPEQKPYLYFIFGLIIGLLIMVRPVNVIFLPVFFLFNQPDWKTIKSLLIPFLIIICTVALVTIPQLLYWKYSSGHLLTYAYKNEGFTNLLSPKMLSIWFSTNNGLVIFSPMVLLVLGGLICMKKQHPYWSLSLGIYFLFISYIFSSWWFWSYGGSYGSRPFVEYYTLFALPFCFFIQYILKNKASLYIFGSLIILCIAWNLKLIFSFDGYWYWGDWDWQALGRLLASHPK